MVEFPLKMDTHETETPPLIILLRLHARSYLQKIYNAALLQQRSPLHAPLIWIPLLCAPRYTEKWKMLE